MSGNSRAVRLGEAIKEIVATMLERRIKDPRLGFVTVTDASVTGDLQHATVFYTVLGDETDVASSAAALESAKGFLRTEVGRRTGVKLTPSLTFQLDKTPQTAADIAEALRVAAVRDAEIRQLAEGAQHAGESDPYKKPASEDDDLDEGDLDGDDDGAAAESDDDESDDGAAAESDDDESDDGAAGDSEADGSSLEVPPAHER